MNMVNDVQNLINELKRKGKRKGLYLHRYQTNKGGHRVKITYSFHNKSSKPTMSASTTGPSTTLNQLEGVTKRSEAYRKLYSLLNRV